MSNRPSYIVYACVFSIDSNNKLCPLPLLGRIFLAVDLASDYAASGMVEWSRQRREHIWPVYFVIGSHGE